MKMRKEEAHAHVEELPEEFDLEELIYRLYLREKVARGEADIAAGRILTVQEVRDQVASWWR